MKPGDPQFDREIKLIKTEREAHRWRRIANRLYEAFTDPDAGPHQKRDAIETYLNYAQPDDDE